MLYQVNLYYLPNYPVDYLHPIRDLAQMIQEANSGDSDALANSVRLNWMVQNLRTNSLRKPILVDCNFNVVVGDTRLMAVKLLDIPKVNVLAQLPEPQDYTIVTTLDHLKSICGFDTTAELMWRPEDRDILHQPVDWFEIADTDTSDHMHNEQQRLTMIKNYLQAHPGFEFTTKWYQQAINWSTWDNLAGH